MYVSAEIAIGRRRQGNRCALCNIMMMTSIKVNIESLLFIWTDSYQKCDTIVIMDKR